MTQPRHFVCLRCGCDVFRPERDQFDDWICLNCRLKPPKPREEETELPAASQASHYS